MNLVLLLPVVGAFLQLLLTHRVPPLAWAVALLVAALATRVVRRRAEVRERPALLGHDGVALADGFVATSEMASVEHDHGVVRITMRSGVPHELRVDASTDGIVPLVEALERSVAEGPRENASENLLAELDTMSVRLRVAGADAYRGFGVDVGRCLAVAEDAGARPKVRIAAARLLANHPDDDVRARMAEVAESTADPALRRAILNQPLEVYVR